MGQFWSELLPLVVRGCYSARRQLDDRTDDPIYESLLNMAREASGFRQKLVDHVSARHQALQSIQQSITSHNNTAPGTDPAAAAGHAAVGRALQTMFDGVAAAYDAKIDAVWSEACAFYALASIAFNILTDSELSYPAAITDYARLGDQMDFLDNFINASIAPVDDAVGGDLP